MRGSSIDSSSSAEDEWVLIDRERSSELERTSSCSSFLHIENVPVDDALDQRVLPEGASYYDRVLRMDGASFLADVATRSRLDDLEVLRRQVLIDVPRSRVRVEGREVRDLASLETALEAIGIGAGTPERLRNTLLMATQAVLATPLMIVHNTVAPNVVAEIDAEGRERGSDRRVSIDITQEATTVSKLLRVVDFGEDGCTIRTDHMLRIDLTLAGGGGGGGEGGAEPTTTGRASTMMLAMRAVNLEGSAEEREERHTRTTCELVLV